MSIFSRLIFIPTLLLASRARAVISDLAGPSDYGTTIQPTSYDLAGLTVGDDRQEFLNSCYWNAVTDAIIHQNPAYLARNYQVQPDGTVNVTYYRDDSPITINVTPAINTQWVDPTTSFDDSNGNGEAAIMLKAFAYFREPTENTMADENFGFPIEPIQAFGLTGGQVALNVAAISQVIESGGIAVVDTGPIAPPGGVADHSYPVWSVDPENGTITLYNPWGDGYEGIGVNEFLTFTDQDLLTYSDGVFFGQDGGAAIPEPGTLGMMIVGVGLLLRRRRAA